MLIKTKILYLSIIPLLALAVILFLRFMENPAEIEQYLVRPITNNTNLAIDNAETTPLTNTVASMFQSPLTQAGERVTKKPFGILIIPETSPIQPERFSGYHTGADFEVFPEEPKDDVTVSAVCAGTIIQRGRISGYGGVVTQSCQFNGEAITVLYGHLRLSSIQLDIGDTVGWGEDVGLLGTDRSAETDGERKHLHIAFHKGSEINLKGYVAIGAELSNWIDPCQYVCNTN